MVSGIRIGAVRLEVETNRPSRTGLGRVFAPKLLSSVDFRVYSSDYLINVYADQNHPKRP